MESKKTKKKGGRKGENLYKNSRYFFPRPKNFVIIFVDPNSWSWKLKTKIDFPLIFLYGKKRGRKKREKMARGIKWYEFTDLVSSTGVHSTLSNFESRFFLFIDSFIILIIDFIVVFDLLLPVTWTWFHIRGKKTGKFVSFPWKLTNGISGLLLKQSKVNMPGLKWKKGISQSWFLIKWFRNWKCFLFIYFSICNSTENRLKRIALFNSVKMTLD